MATRDLLLLIGFLRSGQMFPTAIPFKSLPATRSLKLVHEGMAEQERALFGKPSRVVDRDDLRRRAAVASWSGDVLPLGTRIGEVPDPGVLLCLLYDGPAEGASLPADVFGQTLRRYALRDPTLRARFEEHVDEAGTFVPAWLSPEVRRSKSQAAFETAMKVAREQGFAHAAPLFEGVRGDCFPQAQIAIAIYETREIGDKTSALRRLNEVVRVAPHNVAARMARAKILLKDPGRRVEAASDYLAVLREVSRQKDADTSQEVVHVATDALWALHREFADVPRLDEVLATAERDPRRGFDELSRYVQTHPCAWDAQTNLASLSLSRELFDLSAKLLVQVRWLYPSDPNPHFVYGQALASKGLVQPARRALEYAARLAPDDTDIARWLGFVRDEQHRAEGGEAPPVSVAHHVARSLLVLLAFVRGGQVFPTVLVLHKLPGDVALALALQAIAAQERRRFAVPSDTTEGEVDLRGIVARSELTDYAGEPLGAEQTVGEVPDPGVVVAVLYDQAVEDEAGLARKLPPAAECRAMLMEAARSDSELHAKLSKHMRSGDASLRARLDPG